MNDTNRAAFEIPAPRKAMDEWNKFLEWWEPFQVQDPYRLDLVAWAAWYAARAQPERVALSDAEIIAIRHAENALRVSGMSVIANGLTGILAAQADAQPVIVADTTRDDVAVDANNWRELLEAVMRENPDDDNDGNAPGHCHSIPGIWDSDNGDKAGKQCVWCLVWGKARAAIAASKQADVSDIDVGDMPENGSGIGLKHKPWRVALSDSEIISPARKYSDFTARSGYFTFTQNDLNQFYRTILATQNSIPGNSTELESDGEQQTPLTQYLISEDTRDDVAKDANPQDYMLAALMNQRMILCPTCGNKRCPHADDPSNYYACTNSNEPGQVGSAYPAIAASKEPR